jgi:hypothetical protein
MLAAQNSSFMANKKFHAGCKCIGLAVLIFTACLGPIFGQDAKDDFFDAAPFAIPLPEGNGLMWDDPREIHSVTVDFADPIPLGSKLNLEYSGQPLAQGAFAQGPRIGQRLVRLAGTWELV